MKLLYFDALRAERERRPDLRLVHSRPIPVQRPVRYRLVVVDPEPPSAA